MIYKRRITVLFRLLRINIRYHFEANEDKINCEVNDLLTEITMKLDEAMEIIEEVEGSWKNEQGNRSEEG